MYYKIDDSLELSLNDIHSIIISNIRDLMIQLDLHNIHEQFYTFCYLLWNGYFSIDKQYAYNSVNIIDEKNTIFLGRGCCRNNSDLLQEIFSELDIIAEQMGIRLFRHNVEPMMGITTTIEACDYNKKDYTKTDYDHSITLATDRKDIYILDPTLLVETQVLGNCKIYCPNGQYKINNKLLHNDIKNSMWGGFKISKHHTLTNLDIEYAYGYAFEVCQSNQHLINDFFNENYPNYVYVKKLILSKNDQLHRINYEL